MASPVIVPLADVLKSLFNGQKQSDAVEIDVESYLEAATPVIEEICGPIVRRTVTIRRNGGKTAVLLPHWFDDVESVTEDGVSITDYRPDGESGIIHAGLQHAQRRFEAGIRNVIATVSTGYEPEDVPPNVQLATRELVRFTWQQGRQGTRPGYGEPDADTVDLPSGFAVPRRVMEFCRPHRRYGGFA
jgi:hypothetical protein